VSDYFTIDAFPEARSRPEDDPNSRYTPRCLIEQLHREFHFTVDACSALDAPSSHVIGRFWSKLEDGLQQSWKGERVWVNPPFDDVERWVLKAWLSNAEFVVMLIPANRTEQPFWQWHVEPFRDRGWVPNSYVSPLKLSTRFLPSRIRFGHPGNPTGEGVGSPQFGCVLLIWSRTS
jgi:hypothetical protein